MVNSSARWIKYTNVESSLIKEEAIKELEWVDIMFW